MKGARAYIILGVFVLLAAFGAYILSSGQAKTEQDNVNASPGIEGTYAPTDTVSEGDSSDSGMLLAGKNSTYRIYTTQAYNDAIAQGKIVFLDFYATWCPICRVEAAETKAGFDSLTTDRIAGFRVNYNDSETDNDEKALAKQFGVIYQHTKVIIKDGKVVLKDGESWDKQRFLDEISIVTK